jgi:hypothetical protein
MWKRLRTTRLRWWRNHSFPLDTFLHSLPGPSRYVGSDEGKVVVCSMHKYLE